MLFRSFSNVCFYILVGSFPCRHLTVHAHQEFIVVFGFFQTVFYEVHCLYRVSYRQDTCGESTCDPAFACLAASHRDECWKQRY